jgi:hypothetical protein
MTVGGWLTDDDDDDRDDDDDEHGTAGRVTGVYWPNVVRLTRSTRSPMVRTRR